MYAALQVFRAPSPGIPGPGGSPPSPGGITGNSGTPYFLRDLSNSVYQAQWTQMTQGGLATAQFDCRQQYEDTLDLVFGNYVLFGLYGGLTANFVGAGQTQLKVTNLLNQSFPAGSTFKDILPGDVFMVTDGTNTELFKATSVTDNHDGTWTIQFGSPGGAVLGLPDHTLNTYATGSTVVRLQVQGYISQRVHSTAKDQQFSLNVNGFFNRYGSIIVSSQVQGEDGAKWIFNHLQLLAGQPILTAAFNSGTTFNCTDGTALNVGQIVYISDGTNQESFTITAITLGFPATVTVNHAPTKTHNKGDTVYGTAYLPDIVIDTAFFAASSQTINIQASDTPLSSIIATVVRQETGASGTDVQTHACWVDVLRQAHHQHINTSPPSIWNTKLQTHAPVGTSAGWNPSSMVQIKVGRKVYIGGAAGVDALTISAVHAGSGTFDTSSASIYDHPVGDKVTVLWGGTSPTFTMIQQDNGSGWGDTINKIQTTDMDGSQLINAALATGTAAPQNGTVETTLTAAEPSGWGVYPNGFPCASMPFQQGDVVVLNLANKYGHMETLTIASINGNTFYTTTNSVNSHDVGSTVDLQSNSGAGPRIIVEQPESIVSFGWYEGSLSSPDITTLKSLSLWAKQQLLITAWPLLQAAIDLDVASCRLTPQDLLSVPDFSDGVPLIANVSQIQYQWLASMQNVTAAVTAGVLKSTSGAVTKEIAREQAIREQHQNPRKMPHNVDGHMDGGGILRSSTDNTFTVAASTVKYGGVVFQVPAFSGSAPEGESWWGADVSNPSSPTIALMPYRSWNGRNVFADAIYQVTTDAADSTLVAFFQGVKLWRVECRGGLICGVWPLFSTLGSKLANHPSMTLPPTPTFASTSQSVVSLANGISCDLTVNTTFQNIPQDEYTSEIKFYLRTNGSSAWSHKVTQKVSGLPLPALTTSTDSIVFHSVPCGTSVDVGASYSGINGEGAIGVILSNYALPAVTVGGGGATTGSATESTQAVVTTATQILAANSGRLGIIIYNKTNEPLYVGTDNTLTTTLFMDQIGPGQIWALPVPYTGALWVVWPVADSTAGAQANIAAFPS